MARKRHTDTCTLDDLDRILSDLDSPDDEVRAKAVSSVCPCRMGWAGYQQAMEIVERLRKDPSARVRGAAQHVIEESFQMVSGGQPTHRRMVTDEMAAKRIRSRWGNAER